ncbi:hypothetical protein BN2364_2897 [Alloalcanivorax xenomutans]|nr:hypothetical protein BN2364_2897 [Alloalcanivorax xenomutans]
MDEDGVVPSKAPLPIPQKQKGTTFTFGEKIDSLIQYSPLLRKNMEELKRKGWLIDNEKNMLNPAAAKKRGLVDHSGGYANKRQKYIRINPMHNNNPSRFVAVLAHEVGHAVSPLVPDFSSIDAYVDSMMDEEGWAIMHALSVREEIIKNSTKALKNPDPKEGNEGIDINVVPAINELYTIYTNNIIMGFDPDPKEGFYTRTIKELGNVIRFEQLSGKFIYYDYYYRAYYKMVHGGGELIGPVEHKPRGDQPVNMRI